MSTIAITAERVLRILNGGNIQRDTQWHELDVQYLVRDTVAKMVKGEWFNERNEGGKEIDPRYVVTFRNQEVKEDADTGENYIDVPVKSYIRLKDGSGIRSIRPDNTGTVTRRTKDTELTAFIPIPNRFEDIFYQLPACSLEGMYGWMVRRDKIYFTKRFDKTLLEYDISRVTVDVVTTAPEAIGIDEVLPISQEMMQDVITEVVSILRDGKPQLVDKINDENPNLK